MLRLLFTFVILSIISFSGYSNPIYLLEKDSLVVQQSNAGTLLENTKEDVFEFLDLKETYCGVGPHTIAIRSKKNISSTTYLYLSYTLDDRTFYSTNANQIAYKNRETVVITFSLQNYQTLSGEGLKFVVSNDYYKSLSKPFTGILSFMEPLSTSHCDGYSSTLKYSGKIAYSAIAWKLNGTLIPDESKNIIKVTETGKYSAVISYKTCSTESMQHTITKGVVPKVYLEYALNNSICKSSPVPINVETGPGGKAFPFTEYHWELNGRLIEKKNDAIFFAKEPGLYSLTAYQGKCSSKSDSLPVTTSSFLANIIEFQFLDSLTTNNKLTVCKGQMIELKRKQNLKHSDDWSSYRLRPYYNDSILRANNIYLQWQRDGKDIPGENSVSLKTDQPGKYWLQIREGDCIANSNPLEIIHSKTIPFKLKSYFKNSCDIQPIHLYYIAPFEDFYNVTLKFFKDGTDITEKYKKIYGATETGNYHINLKKDDNCEAVSDTLRLTFTKGVAELAIDTLYSCSGKATLINPKYAYGTYEWKLNGKIIPGKDYRLTATEPGLYTSDYLNQSGCKITYRVQVIFNKVKVDLNLFQESATTCEGRATSLRAFVSPYNEYSPNPKIKLYRESKLIGEKIAGDRFAYDYNYHSSALASEFEIGEPGIYSVKIDRANCETISTPLNVTFKKTLSPITSETNSANCTTLIKVSETRNDKYQWFHKDKPIPSFASQIKVNQPGTYFAKIERDECVGFTEKINVDPRNAPPLGIISGDTLVEVGSTVLLKMNFTGTPPFSYKLNNITGGTALNNDHYHPIKIETYSVFNLIGVKNVCGEGVVSGEARIRVGILANEPSIGRHIRIFPVPTTGSIEIEFDQLNRHELSFQVVNMSGQIIISDTKVSEPKQKLDLNHLVPGEYLIRMKAGKEVVTRKIIKH